jgi:hypothetical protein
VPVAHQVGRLGVGQERGQQRGEYEHRAQHL